MLDLELPLLERNLTTAITCDDLALGSRETLRGGIGECADGDDLEVRVELHRGLGVPRGCANERLLEGRMGDGFGRRDEACSHLHASGTHADEGCHRLAMSDPAGDDHRHVAKGRQDFLRQHRGRDRPYVTTGLRPLDHQGIHTGSGEPTGNGPIGCEAHGLASGFANAGHRHPWRQPTGENDVADTTFEADLHQLVELWMHDDEIDAERFRGERSRGLDLGRKELRRHRTASEHTEAAGIGNRRDQIALRHPGHRPAHDRDFATENIEATLPE